MERRSFLGALAAITAAPLAWLKRSNESVISGYRVYVGRGSSFSTLIFGSRVGDPQDWEIPETDVTYLIGSDSIYTENEQDEFDV